MHFWEYTTHWLVIRIYTNLQARNIIGILQADKWEKYLMMEKVGAKLEKLREARGLFLAPSTQISLLPFWMTPSHSQLLTKTNS